MVTECECHSKSCCIDTNLKKQSNTTGDDKVRVKHYGLTKSWYYLTTHPFIVTGVYGVSDFLYESD